MFFYWPAEIIASNIFEDTTKKPPRKLAKKGDKGKWTEHIERPLKGTDETIRISTDEKVDIRIVEDQKPGSSKVKIVPQKAPNDDMAKEVPAKEVTLTEPQD